MDPSNDFGGNLFQNIPFNGCLDFIFGKGGNFVFCVVVPNLFIIYFLLHWSEQLVYYLRWRWSVHALILKY
jgi:hypothetical protein